MSGEKVLSIQLEVVFSVQLTGISSLATHLDMKNNAIAVEQMIDKGVRES